MRILAAMSGGVDSAVAAMLLRESGCEVVGATLRLLDGGSRCCSIEDITDAAQTCARLGIRHYVLDAREVFRAGVLEAFHQALRAGETPNPCVGCNAKVKFGWLLEQALALGCEAIATGHYARIVERDGRLCLRQGADRAKDQSYFLFELSQMQLAHTRFPVGDLDKARVRELAGRLGLRLVAKEESQDLCFVPHGMPEYLREALPELGRPGRIVSTAGQVLGRHRGTAYYTIGQRKGLGLGGGPWYVVALRPASDEVVVGSREEAQTERLLLRDLRWMAPPAGETLSCQVRIRYNHTPAPASLRLGPERTATVVFAQPQFAVTPGQAAVCYAGDTVLGGGWICKG